MREAGGRADPKCTACVSLTHHLPSLSAPLLCTMAAEAAGEAISAGSLPVVQQTPTQSCYKCHGSGKHSWKKGAPCPACKGAGHIPRSQRKRKRARSVKQFSSYLAPGPFPHAEVGQPGDIVAPTSSIETVDSGDTEVCFLTGNWKLLQGVNAHRYSTDDVVTAWVAQAVAGLAPGTPGTPQGTRHWWACRHAPGSADPPRVLDIGCGIGSVLHMLAWSLPQAVCVGLEAQESRHAMALRSAAYNVGSARVAQTCGWMGGGSSGEAATPPRITVVRGDLRDPAALPASAAFPLITGTPPYFDPATAPQTNRNETNACLSEVRGGIEVYCQAAARWLAPGGTFVVCNANLNRQRSFDAATAAGLRVVAVYDVIPRQGKPVLFFVMVCKRQGDSSGAAQGGAGSPPCAATESPLTGESTKRARVQGCAGGEEGKYAPPPWALEPAALAPGVCLARQAMEPPPNTSHEMCWEGTLDEPGPSQAVAPAVTLPLTGPAAESAALAKRLPQAAMHVPDGATQHIILVRDAKGQRTAQYSRLLRQMGKPG